MTTQVVHNSGNDEWYTPPYVLDIARQFLGRIELDPASCALANQFVQADRWSSDSLDSDWTADTIWLNPPYSRGKFKAFVDKFLGAAYRRAVVLVNNVTDTKAGQALMERADAILFLNKRIKYLDHTGKVAHSPVQGQMLLFYGGVPDWTPHGLITRPLKHPSPSISDGAGSGSDGLGVSN